jgi:DNA damage-binding protein 1
MKDKNFQTSQMGVHAAIDPETRIVVLRLYDGILKIINLNASSKHLTAVTQRIEEIEVLDMQFLHTTNKPNLALLYQDNNGRHVATYSISTDESHECDRGPFRQSHVDSEACLLEPVPEPHSGVLIIGQETITYHNGKSAITISPNILRTSVISTICSIDKNRYLCGEINGGIFLLYLDFDSNSGLTSGDSSSSSSCIATSSGSGANTVKLTLKYLGQASVPNCLSYIDNYVVFLGAFHGDSELLRIHTEKTEEGSLMTHLTTYDNLGPIKENTGSFINSHAQKPLIKKSKIF